MLNALLLNDQMPAIIFTFYGMIMCRNRLLCELIRSHPWFMIITDCLITGYGLSYPETLVYKLKLTTYHGL